MAEIEKHCEGLDQGDWPEADCGNHTPHPPHGCPGVPAPADGHTAGCVAGRECEPYCDSHPTRIAPQTPRIVP